MTPLRNMARDPVVWPGEQVLFKELGGELGEFLQWVENARPTLPCPICNEPLSLSGPWYGLDNDGGLSDITGERFWPYLKCGICTYGYSWPKVENAIDDLEGRPRMNWSRHSRRQGTRDRPWRHV